MRVSLNFSDLKLPRKLRKESFTLSRSNQCGAGCSWQLREDLRISLALD